MTSAIAPTSTQGNVLFQLVVHLVARSKRSCPLTWIPYVKIQCRLQHDQGSQAEEKLFPTLHAPRDRACHQSQPLIPIRSVHQAHILGHHYKNERFVIGNMHGHMVHVV